MLSMKSLFSDRIYMAFALTLFYKIVKLKLIRKVMKGSE